MDAEFYVVQTLLWNKPLRPLICECLGQFGAADDPKYLLAELHGSEKLARIAESFGCQPDEAFQHIKHRIAAFLGVEAQPVHYEISEVDLEVFLKEPFITALAAALQVPDDWKDIAPKLFDEALFRNLLVESGIAHAEESTTCERLLFRLLQPQSRQRLATYFGGPVDIWDELERLLNDDATAKLGVYLDCPPNHTLRVLAQRVRHGTPETPQQFNDPRKLDLLGVAKMKELLHAVSEAYLVEALDNADLLRDFGRSHASAQLLGPLIRFYGLSHYLLAIPDLLPEHRTLGSFVRELLPPYSDERYRPALELQCGVSETEIAVTIEFRGPNQKGWTRFLKAHLQDVEACSHFQSHLPKLSDALKGEGETLRERVLTHGVPASLRLEEKAFSLWSRHDHSLTRFFVLSEQTIPDELQVHKLIGQGARRRCGMVQPASRTAYQMPEDIARRLKAEYRPI